MMTAMRGRAKFFGQGILRETGTNKNWVRLNEFCALASFRQAGFLDANGALSMPVLLEGAGRCVWLSQFWSVEIRDSHPCLAVIQALDGPIRID